jgi:hypothetical protein
MDLEAIDKYSEMKLACLALEISLISAYSLELKCACFFHLQMPMSVSRIQKCAPEVQFATT